jgi:diguanylate cyclase (GGDEF)-like protein
MLGTGIGAAIVLVALTAIAARVELVPTSRMRVSAAGIFVVATALVGGPLLGACAGASTQILAVGGVWQRRAARAAVAALQGFTVGLVGERLPPGGVSGAVTLATLGLLIGLALGGIPLRSRRKLLAFSRAMLVTRLLAGPMLVGFLYIFETSPALAIAFAAGLLLVVAAGNRSHGRLEQTLGKERSRARVDALTNAPNRYALAEALTAEQARIRRGGRPAAVCFLDLDRFKTVNDTYGYAAGDALLVDVFQRLRGELRASDLVFRWGGEEFVVLAPHVDSGELADFAERLRLLLATRPFSIDGRPRTITGSVGAVLLDEARPAEAALEQAGRLVRKAKLTRNTAVVDRAAGSAGKTKLSQAVSA